MALINPTAVDTFSDLVSLLADSKKLDTRLTQFKKAQEALDVKINELKIAQQAFDDERAELDALKVSVQKMIADNIEISTSFSKALENLRVDQKTLADGKASLEAQTEELKIFADNFDKNIAVKEKEFNNRHKELLLGQKQLADMRALFEKDVQKLASKELDLKEREDSYTAKMTEIAKFKALI